MPCLIVILGQASKGHQSSLDITKLVRDRGRAGVRLLMMRCMGRGRRVLLLGDNLDGAWLVVGVLLPNPLLLMNCLVGGRRVLLHRLNLGLVLDGSGTW